MKILFKEIRFKNFMSFGNSLTKFQFTDGLTHISGVNGSGKSTISGEALSFGLFGKPYRKIKINEVVNRVNKKNCLVEIDFIKNDSLYTISRSIKPNKIKILKDKEELPLASSSKLIQEEIDAILGIDYNGFRQIVSVSSENNDSFISLSAADKRKIVENILDLQMVSEANKLLKQDRYDLKIKLTSNESSLSGLQTALGELNNYKNKMDTIVQTFSDEKEAALVELNKQLFELNDSKIKIQKEVKDKQDAVDKFDINKLTSDSNEIKSKISTLTSTIGELTGVLKIYSKDVDNLQNTDTCPTCKTKITDDHRNMEITKIRSNVTSKLVELEQAKSQKESLSAQLNSIESDINSFNQCNRELVSANNNKQNIYDSISRVTKSIQDKNNETIPNVSDSDIEELNTKIKDKISEYELTKQHIRDITSELNIIDIAEKVFSDKGIKSEYYSIIVPILNEKLNDYIKQFELPITIMFDEFLEYSIYSAHQTGETLNYFSFSKGEKKKIDISIMLSFIHMSKMVSNWDCNLLFLDEVLDTGVDSEALDNITSLVKDVTVTKNNNSVYVVSHRDINKDVFDRSIEITKDGGFSKISFTN
jgi:DNA repair exonuclease SbcCD ATPase subunit